MQGRTVAAGKIDLRMTLDATNGYVAVSRFRSADSVLILQAFDLEFFQQGEPLEPAMMLKFLNLPRNERATVEKEFFKGHNQKRARKKTFVPQSAEVRKEKKRQRDRANAEKQKRRRAFVPQSAEVRKEIKKRRNARRSV
jgi:hypothetical protein